MVVLASVICANFTVVAGSVLSARQAAAISCAATGAAANATAKKPAMRCNIVPLPNENLVVTLANARVQA